MQAGQADERAGTGEALIIRGRLLWFDGDPEFEGEAARRFIEDGALLVREGRIAAVGDARDILSQAPRAPVADHRPHLVTPGFIDPHIHFPQTQVIASYGAQLLDWLNRYTFVEEQKFADPAHAARNATFFLDELIRNGTTTAVAYCSVHRASAEAFFAESEKRGARMIGGKVMMDRHCPEALRDTPESGYRDSKELIAQWHGRSRIGYAISPRFAITSSEAQLEVSRALVAEHPDCHMQTHMSENRREIETVLSMFPDAKDYLAIYESYGLVTEKSLIGHCIHMSGSEWARMAERRAVPVFCPTSNTFLGSGLFDWRAARDPKRPLRVALATDVGGGTSYSMLRTAGEAYKVLQLNGQSFSPDQAFHAMTRGNAVALGLDDKIGGFFVGAECDAVVLDARATPAMAHRMETVSSLDEELFVLSTLGDERSVVETYMMGKGVKSGSAS
ncbi:guanine deaminase [Terrarubrum flagellatum]|uniref:guanine deaminase n=1 Tax=Terrirubrum flagellatum TaxID=2895980 RepID=UPI0031456D08